MVIDIALEPCQDTSLRRATLRNVGFHREKNMLPRPTVAIKRRSSRSRSTAVDSADKSSPRERKDKRDLVRQGATLIRRQNLLGTNLINEILAF
jgi:hypothetical protein